LSIEEDLMPFQLPDLPYAHDALAPYMSRETLEYHHDEKDIRKTVECVDYPSRLGELSLNVTLGDEPRFHWPHWIDYNSFRDYFPSQAPRTPTCGWGDLIICMRPPNAR
jgi:hypothetical protein